MAYKKKVGDKNTDEAKVLLWQNKISASEKHREKIAKLYRWKELTDKYKGLCYEEYSDIYIPSLNLGFAYVKTEIPSLALRDPKIKVNAKTSKAIRSAKILEQALAYTWRHNRYKRENKKNILDAKLIGHSWFKSGYCGNFGSVEEGDSTYQFIKSEEFFGYRVPYNTITFNTDAMDAPFDCTWIAQEVWKPLDFVKDQENGYENTDDLDPASIEDDQKEADGGKKRNDYDAAKPDFGVPLVKLYEVWNKLDNEFFVISDSSRKFLKSPKSWPYQLRGFPFSYLKLNDNPDSAYPMPDMFMFDSQIDELTKIRAMAIDHLKRFNRQYMYREDALEADQASQMAQGITGAMIKVKINSGESINNVIAPVQYPPLQQDAYAIQEWIKEDMINVSGQSPQERGATQKTSTRTFRELAQIDRGAKNRRSDQQDTVEDFIEDIAANQIALWQQLADIPMYVRVTGQGAQEILESFKERPSALKEGAVTDSTGFTFTKEDIQGEFDIEVVAGSTAPMDHDNRMSLLVQIMEMLPQLGVMPGGPVIAAIGLGLAEEMDLPEVVAAIQAEGQARAQQAEEAKQQQDIMTQMQTAQVASQLQLDAEKQGTDQNKLILQAYQILADLQAAQDKAKREREGGKKGAA